MANIKNDRLLRALRREAVDRTPVWIMRQAGRYMPEYRAIRQQAGDFLTLCKTPELACEVTMLPVNRFDLDAAILFSDILMIPDAMQLGLEFKTNEGPTFARVITSARDVQQLPDLDPEMDMPFIGAAVRLIKQALHNRIPLIGFAGSPWTVATYMIEGQTSKQHNKVRGLMYQDPLLMHQLLDHLTKQTVKYLQAQINAGVDCLMLFDTWGGLLSEAKYKEFSLQYMQQIVQQLDIPILIFTKNGGKYLVEQAATGCTGIGLDWTADLANARKLVGDRVALQGNLDPCVLYADSQTIIRETHKVLDQYAGHPGHIFNLGHGIAPDINPENVEILIETVHTYDKNSSVSRNI